MKYEVGRPYISVLWVYLPHTALTVTYYSQASMGDFPSDSQWIVPGTLIL